MSDPSEIEQLYSTWADAHAELMRRRDSGLAREVRKYWGQLSPPFLARLESPAAILSRPIATPNYETIKFCNDAIGLRMNPYILELPGKFVSINAEKRHLWRMEFTKEVFGAVQTKLRLFDRQSSEGRIFSEIVLESGGCPLDLHRNLLRASIPQNIGVIDMTQWFQELKSTFSDYYMRFMMLFLCHAVWFENYFLIDRRERQLIELVVLPAYQNAIRTFGCRPLIVRFLPAETEASVDWHKYPIDVLEYAAHQLGASRPTPKAR